ncbi:BtrH N-terminal domain-containing protein [Sinosporangium album]|nr:BtrH N-terminal domain-containing protein [Sinosporangium album]
MTSRKQFKARVRQRMAKTGESYTVALRHFVRHPEALHDPRPEPSETVSETVSETAGTARGSAAELLADHGWRFLGGRHSHSASVTSVLVNAGVQVSEAAVFLAGGGIGAGYILWEFKEHDSRHLVLGFRNRWQYHDSFLDKALGRLGVPSRTHRTGGAKSAAAVLAAELDGGHPCVVLPDRYQIGYWGLPAHLDGHGGHPVVAYRRDASGVFVDDRGLVPVHVPQERMDAARARVGSYKNISHVLEPVPIGEERLAAAVLDGLRDCAEHLSGSSDSFALPAWRKWARMTGDRRNAKGWPKVFAGGRGLAGALLSIWEAAGPDGMDGGDLRDLFADGLAEAAALLDRPRLERLAAGFREIHDMWGELADAAFPADIPDYARMRELTASVRLAVLTEGAIDLDAAAELWRLRGAADAAPPPFDQEEHCAALGRGLAAIHEAETAAVAALRTALAD